MKEIFKKWWFWILIVLFVGGLIGFIFPNMGSCNQKFCLCEGDGELSCNSCEYIDFKFYTGIVNLAKICPGTEIILCEDGESVEKNVVYSYNDCKYYFNSILEDISFDNQEEVSVVETSLE
jgi:hypothetical protein